MLQIYKILLANTSITSATVDEKNCAAIHAATQGTKKCDNHKNTEPTESENLTLPLFR